MINLSISCSLTTRRNFRRRCTTKNSYLWIGQIGYYTDESTGQTSVRFRIYWTDQARFISEDPAQSEFNWYRYVWNSPLNATDPSGLNAKLPWDHHWFPQSEEFQKLLQGKCSAIFNLMAMTTKQFIDQFTTTFTPGWGRKIGSWHLWLEWDNPGGRYQPRVRDIYTNSKNCCTLLKEMKKLIQQVSTEIWQAQQGVNAQGPVAFPVLHNHQLPGNNNELFDHILDFACKNPDKQPDSDWLYLLGITALGTAKGTCTPATPASPGSVRAAGPIIFMFLIGTPWDPGADGRGGA